VLDDELNVLPISRGKDIQPLSDTPGKDLPSDDELKSLKESLSDMKPAEDLVKLTKTVDQAKAILTFIDAIAEKTLSSTVTLTAARGRGKSAALGLAMAAALDVQFVGSSYCTKLRSRSKGKQPWRAMKKHMNMELQPIIRTCLLILKPMLAFLRLSLILKRKSITIAS